MKYICELEDNKSEIWRYQGEVSRIKDPNGGQAYAYQHMIDMIKAKEHRMRQIPEAFGLEKAEQL